MGRTRVYILEVEVSLDDDMGGMRVTSCSLLENVYHA